jgi:hypothetical protein
VTIEHLPEADHTFSSRAASESVNAACARWLSGKAVSE